jgi:hypothetical protein
MARNGDRVVHKSKVNTKGSACAESNVFEIGTSEADDR